MSVRIANVAARVDGRRSACEALISLARRQFRKHRARAALAQPRRSRERERAFCSKADFVRVVVPDGAAGILQAARVARHGPTARLRALTADGHFRRACSPRRPASTRDSTSDRYLDARLKPSDRNECCSNLTKLPIGGRILLAQLM